MDCNLIKPNIIGIDISNKLHDSGSIMNSSDSYTAPCDCIAIINAVSMYDVKCDVYLDGVYIGSWSGYSSALTSPNVSWACIPLAKGSTIMITTSGSTTYGSVLHVYGLK